MNIERVIFVKGYTKDGHLGTDSGRIIMYEDNVLIGWNKANDHNDLLRGFARRYRYNTHIVISNATRLYFSRTINIIIVSECRKIDYDIFTSNEKYNLQLIWEEASR